MLLPNDAQRLRHICLAAEEIQQYIAGVTRQEFLQNRPLQYLVVHNLQTIGEASSRLSTGLLETYVHLPWRNIIGMRNRIVHDYLELDIEMVWNTATEYLPGFTASVRQIMAQEIG